MTAKPKRAPRRADKTEFRQPRPRANEVELQLRYADVASLLLSRFSRAQIAEFSKEKWGVVSEAQTDDYIAAAKQLIKDRIAENQNATIDDHIDALMDLARRARGAKDLRIELDVRKDIAKVLGYYAPIKIDDTGLSDDERAKRIATLLDSARARRDGRAVDDAPAASGSGADSGTGADVATAGLAT